MDSTPPNTPESPWPVRLIADRWDAINPPHNPNTRPRPPLSSSQGNLYLFGTGEHADFNFSHLDATPAPALLTSSSSRRNYALVATSKSRPRLTIDVAKAQSLSQNSDDQRTLVDGAAEGVYEPGATRFLSPTSSTCCSSSTSQDTIWFDAPNYQCSDKAGSRAFAGAVNPDFDSNYLAPPAIQSVPDVVNKLQALVLRDVRKEEEKESLARALEAVRPAKIPAERCPPRFSVKVVRDKASIAHEKLDAC